ncbi:MAG: PAS domain S-box protein [Myxococcota bacterium]
MPPDAPARGDATLSLQQERERAAAIIASVPGVVWEAWGQPDAASQRIDFVSDFVTEFLGYSVEEWLATPNFWLEIVHPDDRARAAAEAYAIFSSCGRMGVSRFRWVAKDGRARWVEARSTTICDADGAPVGMRGVTFDVHKQVEAERRFAVQAAVSVALADSLDVVETLRTVTGLLVPAIADLSAVHLLQPDGGLALMDAAHLAFPRVPATFGVVGGPPFDPRAFGAYRRAMEGKAVLVPEVTPAHFDESGLDAAQVTRVRAFGLRSVMVVPLATRNGPVGTLTLASCRPDRRFGDDDLALAVELGQRCGVAVDNARLFVTARDELDQRRLAEARLERKALQQEVLAELGRIALGPSTTRAVARRACARVREVCDFDAVYVIDVRPAGFGLTASSGGSGTLEADVLVIASRAVGEGVAMRVGELSAVLVTVPPRRFGALVARGGAGDHDEGRFLELVANVLASATERERAEAALQQEKERLAVTLRSIGDGVIATDVDARVVLVNAVAEQLTGWAQADAIGRALPDVFPIVNQRTRVAAESPILDVLRSGGMGPPSQQTAVLARPGHERVVAHNAAAIRDRIGNIVGAVFVFRDITDKERIDAELQRATTLESLGVLAGGIAHDFNNILTAVLANVSLASLLLPAEHPAHARVAEAERAALRARDLTQQLLTFARGGAPVRTPTSIAAVVRESAGFVLSGSALRARYTIDPHPWVVEADAGQISQVVQNLVLNAVQALLPGAQPSTPEGPDGGSIDIEVHNVRLDAPMGLPIPPGAYVRVDVADHGPGIERAHLPRIFDPFFTTKPSGSGLGLASAYAIVKKHDGHIAVVSEPGCGARFSVYLPIAGPGQRATAPAVPVPVVRGVGRVLVMDDDPAVRSTIADLLGALGYHVALTADGTEAVEAWRRALDSAAPFHCALLDLTVPGGMGGLRTLRALRAVDPAVRAIVSSGYSEDPVMANFVRHGFVDVLRKPYTMREVSAVLARVVGPVR